MQFVNVKVILYGITTFSTLVLPYFSGVWQVSLFILILTIVGFSGTCCWAMFGSIFSKVFAEHKKRPKYGDGAIAGLLRVFDFALKTCVVFLTFSVVK